MKKKYLQSLLVFLLLNCCVKERLYNACNVIQNPSHFLNKTISIDAIIIYDEHPKIYSTDICQHFNYKNKYLSAEVDFADEKLMKDIYQSRDMSFDDVRYGSKMKIIATVRKSMSIEQGTFYYLDIDKYMFKEIVRF